MLSNKIRSIAGKIARSDQIPKELIPDKIYLGTDAPFYYGWEGKETPTIKNDGLITGIKIQFKKNPNNRLDSLYFATSPERARVYASLYPDPIVLEIDTRHLNSNKFFYDPGDFPNEDGSPGQIAYRGNVPANFIKIFSRGL